MRGPQKYLLTTEGEAHRLRLPLDEHSEKRASPTRFLRSIGGFVPATTARSVLENWFVRVDEARAHRQVRFSLTDTLGNWSRHGTFHGVTVELVGRQSDDGTWTKV